MSKQFKTGDLVRIKTSRLLGLILPKNSNPMYATGVKFVYIFLLREVKPVWSWNLAHV